LVKETKKKILTLPVGGEAFYTFGTNFAQSCVFSTIGYIEYAISYQGGIITHSVSIICSMMLTYFPGRAPNLWTRWAMPEGSSQHRFSDGLRVINVNTK